MFITLAEFDCKWGVYIFYVKTPIARSKGCVSSLRISVGDSLWNYSVAIRVNRVMLVSLCAEAIKPVFEGDKI